MAPLSLSDAAVGQREETGTRVTVLGGKCALFTCGQVGGACEAACTPGITLPPSPMAPTQGDTDGVCQSLRSALGVGWRPQARQGHPALRSL